MNSTICSVQARAVEVRDLHIGLERFGRFHRVSQAIGEDGNLGWIVDLR